MILEHPVSTMLTDLLNADDNFRPDDTDWHEAQEEMERRAFARGPERRVGVLIRTSRKSVIQSAVTVEKVIIDQEIIEHVMSSDSAVSAVGLEDMSHEISDGVRRIVLNEGAVEDFSSAPKNSFDHFGTHISKVKSSQEKFRDEVEDRPSKRPSYLGGVPSLPHGDLSRAELDAILDGPDSTILDEIEAEQRNASPPRTPPLKTQVVMKDAEPDTEKKQKKQKFIQKGKLYGQGGRNNRKRGRHGPPNCH